MNKRKSIKIKEYELPISITEEKEGGFVATCPLWNDCYAQGDTIEEAIKEISSVASSLIEVYKEERLQIPLKIKQTDKKEKYKISVTYPLIISDR